MKRSAINTIMQDAKAFIAEHGFMLPPFAYWTPEDWAEHGPAAQAIIDCGLGWDITDFGQGDYENLGLFLFTIRNGRPENLQQRRGKLYAEKLLITGVGQVTPLHYHWLKTEDIINRGGGQLVIQLYNGTEDGGLRDDDVTVQVDGLTRTVPAGGELSLAPGESITLEPYCYHAFWAEDAPVLVGEVSTVNDDSSDNRFYEPVGRFPQIEEDAPPLHYLVTDYEQLKFPN